MSKNTGHAKDELPELEESEAFEEREVKRSNSTYSLRIQELLAKCEIQETPTFTLYKYENPVSGEEKSFIERYVQDDPPTEDVIGTSFGSGRYMLIMAAPTKVGESLARVYKFKINSRFDKLAFPQSAGAPPQQSQLIVRDNSSVQMFEMFERFMRMITPLLIRPADPDIKAFMMQNFKDTAEVLKKQQLSQVKAWEGMRDQIELAGEDMPTATTEKETSIIEQITPFIQQFLPLLIGGGKKAEGVAAVARATPQFAAIVKDRGNFQRLLKHLDATEGKEKTDKILSALKLKR
ncbi:MAG: hypothetical protein PHE88_12420 [Elusimicrobia bacterium]|nr:hypothetical protein [Elusimicrobiota bacterium]